MPTGQSPDYFPLTGLQQQLIDKLTDAPLAGGVVYFFSDTQRTIPKEVFTLSNNPPDYTYASLGTSLTLSSLGTFDDGLGNAIIPYLHPFNSNGDIELYYVSVFSSGGQFQFALGNLPFLGESAAPESTFGLQNFISNGQFLLGQNGGTISATVTNVAYGNWQYIRSSNASTDTVTFPRFNAPLNGIPSGNPRYACKIACTIPNAGDTYKTIQVVFQDVNRFSDPNQQLTLYFEGLNNQTGLLELNVDLYKNFGTGGSTPTTTPIGSYAFNNTGYINTVLPFFFGSNYGQTLGSNNDDYFAIQIQLPPTTTFDVSVTDFALYLGNVDVTAYPFTPDLLQYVQPYYSSWVKGYIDMAINLNSQLVPGSTLTVPAGTYLLSYSVTVVLNMSDATPNHTQAVLNNITTPTNVSPLQLVQQGNSSGYCSGTIGWEYVVTFTVPTQLGVYVNMFTTTSVTAFGVWDPTICALRLGIY